MAVDNVKAASPPAGGESNSGKGDPEPSKAASPPETTTPAAASPTTASNDQTRANVGEMAADDDTDSVISHAESLDSSTASMNSSVLQYRTIMGRTYHSERGTAQYWGANDELQNESMDMNHEVLTMAIGDKLHLAPLPEKLDRAVDIGTGTGLWAIDFADAHPECSVIGTDLSPIQPGWTPPNCEFQIDDCTQEWTFAADSLDYVHMRYLTGSIVDWSQTFANAFRCCKPGGYFESFEASPYHESDDGTVVPGSAQAQWGDLFVAGSPLIGRTFRVVPEGLQRKCMEEAGFVDIDEYNTKVPFGAWPKNPRLKEMGRFAQATLEQDVEGYVTFIAGMQGWTKEEITVYAAKLRKEIRDPKIHSWFHVKVVWGRKPT